MISAATSNNIRLGRGLRPSLGATCPRVTPSCSPERLYVASAGAASGADLCVITGARVLLPLNLVCLCALNLPGSPSHSRVRHMRGPSTKLRGCLGPGFTLGGPPH